MPSARVQFWGTRGSLAKPGPTTLRYGGNTSCVQVTSPAGTQIIIDCGTGMHDLGRALLAKAAGQPLRGHILISHTHWDHIQGFPFFAPLFIRGGEWDIYGAAGLGKSLQETMAGQMQYTYFPVTLAEMGATIRFNDLIEGFLEIEDVRITTRYLNHSVLTLGYRLEMPGATVVYCCDHEPHAWVPGQRNPLHESDREHLQFIEGADLLIHDAQFTDAEYPSRKGWGHSTFEYVVGMAELAGVRQVALTHHDPTRTDEALDQLIAKTRAELATRHASLRVFGAAEGPVIELAAGAKTDGVIRFGETVEVTPATATPAFRRATVLHVVPEGALAAKLEEACQVGGVRIRRVTESQAALDFATATPPDLIVMEDLPGADALALCRALRASPEARLQQVPFIVVAAKERAIEGQAAGVTAWLVSPFSAQYARAFLQSWILRSKCRWVLAPVPPDEDRRLEALQGLKILDTPAEHRFDRLSRLAAVLADVPVVTVTLVDTNRQWFKSCVGLESDGTSRELSFCAHVVADRRDLVVPDTFEDDRFADHPLVTGAPRIRFYAGFPVYHADGACLGTLCLIDTRPRQLSQRTVEALRELATLVEQELNTPVRRAA